MAYTLEALVWNSTTGTLILPKISKLREIALPQNINLIPLTPELLRELKDITPGTRRLIGNYIKLLSPMVIKVAESMSFEVAVAYIKAEFFGGVGEQASMGWQAGQLVFGPVQAKDAINQALRWLGVVTDGRQDEFDQLGLGQHRSTSEWTK